MCSLTLLNHISYPLEWYYKGIGNACLILIFHHENSKWLKKRIYWISEVIYLHLRKRKKTYRKYFQNYRVYNLHFITPAFRSIHLLRHCQIVL